MRRAGSPFAAAGSGARRRRSTVRSRSSTNASRPAPAGRTEPALHPAAEHRGLADRLGCMRHRLATASITGVTLLLTPRLGAAAEPRAVPRVAAEVRVDGRLDEPAWQDALA